MNPGKKRNQKQKSNQRGGPPKHVKRQNRSSRGALPDVMTLIVAEITDDGELLGTPEEWPGRKQPPVIYVSESRQGPAVGMGDRVLANMRRVGAHEYKAHVIRILPKEPAKLVVGIFVPVSGGGGLIEPVSRRTKESYRVAREEVNGVVAGELVKASTLAGAGHGLPFARIEERLGDARAPRAASLIAAHLHLLPSVFSAAALAEAEAAGAPVLSADREDLRSLPLVTIDGEDARDFDDAVFAEPDTDSKNEGGFHLVVAIADVAHYVTEQSALDADAFMRGNSAYFPDRVIPMLPERLSNGLCSLKPGQDRYCLAVHIWIDAHGNTRRYRFTRALMRSQARLTYMEVENAGKMVNDAAVKSLVANLFAAYRALVRERDKRGTLEINLPEYKVQFDALGNVEGIVPRESLESHRLIEAFMVTANVAAADFLLKHRAPGIYRVHEAPSEDKMEELRKFLGLSGYSLPKGLITPAHLNRVLHKAGGAPNAAMIHTMVLRSQMQAYYDGKNFGHFGLGLKQYCHFTSPIRRYADLIVHRSLAGLLSAYKEQRPAQNLKEIAAHISETERTAMMAERDAMDRYKIAYLAHQREKSFSGSVTAMNEYGLFVSLKGNGITGFVPVHQLGDDFFVYNPRTISFKGRQGNRTYMLGDALTVRVVEADIVRGSLIFRPEGEGKEPRGCAGKAGKRRTKR